MNKSCFFRKLNKNKKAPGREKKLYLKDVNVFLNIVQGIDFKTTDAIKKSDYETKHKIYSFQKSYQEDILSKVFLIDFSSQKKFSIKKYRILLH